MAQQFTNNPSSDDCVDARQHLPPELLINALEAMTDGLFLFDSSRLLLLANQQAESLQSNVTRLRIGSRCCEMFWQDGDPNTCVVDRALENGLKLEFEIPASAVARTPLFITVQPIQVDDEGSELGALVIARDISKLRNAEAEAIAHKSFMANLADRSPDEIYALDKLGRITWVNQRAEKGSPLMLLGQRLIDFISIDSRDPVSAAITRALSGGDTQSEILAVRPDETDRDVEANISPLWKDGDVDGVLVFLRDTTERKRTQELISQSDKLRAVGELAAGVAHNLNNSLTVIKGRTQLLQMKATDEATLKSLQVINEAVEDGGKTLRRILEFARRDSAQGFGPVELDDLVTSSIEIARPKWQRKSGQPRIEMKMECNGPVYVQGDLAELREVVLNLIFNSVDAMPEGGTIEIGTRGELDSGCFWVADTGCGMPPETAARIFEPFFTTKGAKGTGLGLSASHGIISRHRGEIFAVSEPGEGTRFEIRLPICDALSRTIKSAAEELAST
ncbi:MAG TPA: ATP-binding protein [Pyrinomonadaceae bacterium]|jgi:PAS domain S-box-containing protein|nr:ATP-binding protein [Pyrinomonadaceae bacterium]